MTSIEALCLGATAAAAGAINAVAGGGTLLTFPALLFFNTSPVVANATSTFALVVGTAGSLVSFRQQLHSVRHWLARFLPVSLLGGWLGSFLLTRTSDRVFSQLVPFLLLFATIVFILQGAFRKFAGKGDHAEPAPVAPALLWGGVLFQFGVALYGGYFGAGIGILMLASLGILGVGNIHQMNALKNVLGSMINLVAACWFVWSGLVDWPKAGVMMLGALGGYYLGAHFSQKLPHHAVRRVVTAVGLVISAVMFYRQFIA